VLIERRNGFEDIQPFPRWTQFFRDPQTGEVTVAISGRGADFRAAAEIKEQMSPEEIEALPVGHTWRDDAGRPVSTPYGTLRARCNPKRCTGDYEFNPFEMLVMGTSLEVTLQ
jgi:hypothetical protein